MPERKVKRDRAASIVHEAAAEGSTMVVLPSLAGPAMPREADYDLALKSACLAEATPKDELVRRVMVEWLRGRGYLK